ncbi:MAG TPA: flagellar motor protein MotB [Verrucomicrobiae bacterium]|jgi:chemotaxis protein MotB|nr:flagellar motor protein MotB [Verrucomicrobiae bacterium]
MAHKKGHHGGAWKVAYADFTTAMMALFIVLWLTSQDQRIKDAVERAFRNPFSSVTKDSVGIIPTKDTQAVRSESGNFNSASAIELTILRRLNQDIMKSLQSDHTDDQSESPVNLQLTTDGLRINVFDKSHRPIFEPQSTRLTPYGDWVFSTLAWEIARYTNFCIELEGHTEKGHPAITPVYGDWELSADRANAVRRKLVDSGVLGRQIKQVAGFGDTVPMPEYPADNECNRRVTVLLNVGASGKKS